jgi:hypothetical protein
LSDAFRKLKGLIRETSLPIIVFIALDLCLTLLFFGISNPSVHIGTLRPVSTIPLKLLELALAGLAVGLVASLVVKRVDLGLITIAVTFTALLDIDHLPSFFGVAQPIRPAHSIAFFAITLVGLALVARGRWDIQAIFVASFLAHLASDTGVFAVLVPFSFNYMSMQAFRIPLAAGSVVFALLAGYLKRRWQLPVPRQIMVKGVMNQK